MPKASPEVQIPGAAGDDAPIDPKDAEIAALKAQLAAATAAPTQALVIEADTPHGRIAMAQSQHKHLTSKELDAAVRSGEVKLVDRHVLCKDGWYVNPNFVQG